MIDSLEGTLTSKTPAEVTVQVSGLGYRAHVPLSTFSALPVVGDPVRLLTHLYVREDQIKLYGFASEAERELFLMLLGVNRVGPAVAIQVLSSCPVEEFRRLVGAGDVAKLSSMVKGVGKKTAQRLVLELKGELAMEQEDREVEAGGATADVVKALISLGETPANARKLVRHAVKRLGPDADEEALMREVLSG